MGGILVFEAVKQWHGDSKSLDAVSDSCLCLFRPFLGMDCMEASPQAISELLARRRTQIGRQRWKRCDKQHKSLEMNKLHRFKRRYRTNLYPSQPIYTVVRKMPLDFPIPACKPSLALALQCHRHSSLALSLFAPQFAHMTGGP